jgi:hypothetical protein
LTTRDKTHNNQMPDLLTIPDFLTPLVKQRRAKYALAIRLTVRIAYHK